MFILHASNRTENLLAHLSTVIASSPLSSPFAKEIFLIQSQGMERWLAQQLANEFKVWSNYEFLFPNRFFSAMALRVDSGLNDASFERGCLLWRIEALLRQLQDPAYALLQNYLCGPNTAIKRYQLARQLAQLFDQYQIMRPDMLNEWQQGRTIYQSPAEIWQGKLWRQLLERLGEQHRGRLWLQAIAKLQTAEPGSLAERLPERIMVFGLNTMPPLFLAFLQALANHCQVHLYLLNPAQAYWADLQNKRQLLSGPDRQQTTVDGTGHPLLAALGQQGREFQELLLETAEFEFQVDSFEMSASERLNNLQQLQNDILKNQPSDVTLQKDGSISLHACHSRMREVQVLKNQLLQSLETDTELELRDIVVMAPDIQLYEPFISAVFADIQHAIADRSMRISNVLLDVFIGFLRLSQSRFGWQEVLDLLEQPVVHSSFGLSETDLQRIRHWLQELHVRWGQSAEHKAALGLPSLAENTWLAALERMLMGYAFEDENDFVCGALPYADIEGSSAQALGGLHDYLQLLFKASSELGQAKPLRRWAERLHHYSQGLFSATRAATHELQQLTEIINELSGQFSQIHNHDVELDVIINWLNDALQERKSSTGFLRGQLTFCSMLPMRTIPFKVIALLGMNEGEFPKIDSHPTFDLLGQFYRKGDRSRRADDRYQFLEILLSARQQLIITYIGLSNQNNEEKQASVVISEMLEILRDSYQLEGLVTKHPLQAFSFRYFTGAADLFSYSQADYRTARTINAPVPETTAWWQGDLAGEPSEVIEINELFAFFRNPQKYFVQRRLAVFLNAVEAQPEEREPFTVNGLDAYQINQDWIKTQFNNEVFSLQKLQAQGRWLSAVSGEILYEQQQQAIAKFVTRIREINVGDKLDELAVDLSIGSYRLIGKLSDRFENGSLFYRYAKLKGTDFLIALLHHHIINLLQPQKTHLLSSDERLLFEPQHGCRKRLLALLDVYRQGQKNPHVFFVEPALAYIRQALKLKQSGKASKPPMVAAAEQLLVSLENGYDADLVLVCRDIQNVESLLDNNFEIICSTLLLPVWEKIQV